MPLYVGDYLGDTGHLTTTQHGAYLLLMMHYWRKGELPDDDPQLAKITKLPLKTWRDCRPVLQAFFRDGWKHKRIDGELEKMIRAGIVDFEAALGFATNAGNLRLEMQDYLEDPQRKRQQAAQVSKKDSLLEQLVR